MATYAAPATFALAGVGAFAVAVFYVDWASRRWRGPGAKPALAVALATSTLAGIAAGLWVQESIGLYRVMCAAGGLTCQVQATVAAPELYMLLLGAAAGSLLFAAHHVPWRPAAPWLMLSLPLAAVAVASSGAEIRSLGVWLGMWALWLLLLPAAMRVQWRSFSPA